jgi:D-alanyl-D-alanine dipeptidase
VDFVALSTTDATIQQDIRYAGDNNFVGHPLAGYDAAECWLTKDAARALADVQRALVKDGLGLKVFDCYRPQRAVDEFLTWSGDASSETKSQFYPNVSKDHLVPDGYIAPKSGHSRGSTVDLTLVSREETQSEASAPRAPACVPRADTLPDRHEVDMGSSFDCFDPISRTDSPLVDSTQHANRLTLVKAMSAAGFVNYPEEWWHFTLQPEPHPDSYFNFPVVSPGK